MTVGKITKADLLDAIYEKSGANREDVLKVVNSFIEELRNALVSNKTIELRGFGTFEIRTRKGREKARNPKTGETVSVSSHKVVAFRSGKDLKRDVWYL